MGSMAITVGIYVQNDPENVYGTTPVWLLFISDLLSSGFDPDLKYGLRTQAVSFLDISQQSSTLGEFELLASHLTNPIAKSGKTLRFGF